MPDVMLQLGEYQFSVNTATYQQLRRSTAYRWKAQSRINQREALQHTGPGSDEITLQGTIYPQYKSGLGQIDDMRSEADKAKPLTLVDGRGGVHGRWVIAQIDETQGPFARSGAPKKQTFTLRIKKYGDELQD